MTLEDMNHPNFQVKGSLDTGWGAKEAVVYDPKVGVKRNTTLGVSVRPEANAINVLQTCNYKSVKTGPLFKITFFPTYCQIQNADAGFHFLVPCSFAEEHGNIE